ncbi:MAG: DUF29 domain-containing protein [Methyloprofundus sp.]|nr:DUF29 domain-containing protein [Methyloprofundus sp.]MDT8425594.1 DUF29 domain-containing protein [Methyloprofundus sp.]
MSQLHEQDFYAWTQQQVHLLKDDKLDEIDVAALIEALESMGAREKRELLSHLEGLLMHLLKWQYQPERQGKSWEFTIQEQRDRIRDHLSENPSLSNPDSLAQGLIKAYNYAVRKAVYDTGFKVSHFPKECPYSFEQILDMDYYPNEDNHEN